MRRFRPPSVSYLTGAVALGGVEALAGDDVADAAPWVGYVAAVARDEVDVQVEDGLACGFADVDADVEAVGVVAAARSSRPWSMAAVMAARSSVEASNQVGTCLRGTISRWPSLTGKASQRALVSRSSKAIRSWVGKQKGQAAGVVIVFGPTWPSVG